MKKAKIILGILLLAAAVVLVIAGTQARSLFYGIMDAPYTVYGKYGTAMKWCYIAAAVSGALGIVCLAWRKRK